MDLEDLDALVAEVERRGFRARFLDPMAPDPIEYQYLPALERDGVREPETQELLAKVRKVALVRKWTDIVIVDPALEPVTGNHVAHVPGTVINNDHLSVEEILATARIGIPASELPKSVYSPLEEDDPFDRTVEQVALEQNVSLARLRRLAISEDVDGVENLHQALTEVALGMKSND